MYHNTGFVNEAHWIVAEFLNKKMLSKIGYRFEDDLEDFEVECFAIISNELVRLENEEMSRSRKK